MELLKVLWNHPKGQLIYAVSAVFIGLVVVVGFILGFIGSLKEKMGINPALVFVIQLVVMVFLLKVAVNITCFIFPELNV